MTGWWRVTLAQLKSFVLVARLGSVTAAANALEVTEPAVSVAVGALRRELGDELFVRSGRGIALTPGGRRLAALAGEILGLAEHARRTVREAPGEARRVEVAATGLVAEHIGPLIEAFTARSESVPVDVAVEAVPGASFPDLLEQRRADVTLGPHPGLERSATIASVPFLRARQLIVAAPGHPLVGRAGLEPASLARERWLVGPPAIDPTIGVGRYFERHAITPAAVGAYTSHAAAIAAAAAGEGIVLTLAHSVIVELSRRALVPLDVRGMPLVELWHASTLGLDRALPAALALQRFATTPEAMQAMSAGRVGTTSARVRPSVHVTLWRGVGDAI
ncbi:LysR family transcriptional regulator [Conexibacter sp. CPCC 206217]|uniref:LysR family transcriptional regulator n=1 Tax=Conexibacter sp. CPCC 206217 TaxID=3064574 RepID=UPI0027181642|nr:LysR family transcriptional regulator [Conexibacter sp. CPCC 206217]MDO8210634.1 LysR family transcriptional regulator [Conexibacter sp. CPCC 206217]